MNVQERTNREAGLEAVMESMYGRSSEGRLSRGRLANPDGTECDHCKGTGHHHDDKGNQTECKKCGGDGWIKDVVKEAPKSCPKCGKVHIISAGCGVKHEAIEEGTGLFSTVKGDPSTWQVGQIIPSQISRDDYDGIIIHVDEENGERTFDVQQVGEEGWTIYASDLDLPDDDTGRIPVPSHSEDTSRYINNER